MIRRNEQTIAAIGVLKAEHPLWGYRRVWAYLKYRQGMPVNKKRVYRLMKEQEFLVTREYKNKAKRTSYQPKPQPVRPDHIWGTDMTKIKINGWGWLYLVVVLDWFTKEVVGYCLSLRCTTAEWLLALNMAVNNRFPGGIKDTMKYQLHVVSDNGCQPTSQRYMRECAALGIDQIFTTWSNPRGNADTERFIRTLKEDLLWCHDWDNPFDFQDALSQWIDKYNCDYPHQSLSYMTPRQFYLGSAPSGGSQKAPKRGALSSNNRSCIPTYFALA